MDMKITPGTLSGTVRAIPSKSQAHRALICAALADVPTRIECEGTSNDIEATASCLSALGADIRHEPDGYVVSPIKSADVQTGESTDPVLLRCGESGSTLRFLLPIVGALGKQVTFMLEGRLPNRPLTPLYEELISHGCMLSPQGSNPFHISGQLTPGRYRLDAGVSSQFISGLLFSLPLLSGNSELHLSGSIESLPYIELTLDMLKIYGIELTYENMLFTIPGRQAYRSPGAANVEGDWSNAAFWLAAGAIGNSSVTCTGLDLNSRQGDRAILEVLSLFGAHVRQSGSSVTVSTGRLSGIEIDARDIPDLVPILAVVATAAGGVTEIINAGRLRGKESDRLASVTDMLSRLGANIRESKHGIVIQGGTPLIGGFVSSWGDHRIAMAAAIAASTCSAPVVIQDAEAVSKSYPRFFDDLLLLGGACVGYTETTTQIKTWK